MILKKPRQNHKLSYYNYHTYTLKKILFCNVLTVDDLNGKKFNVHLWIAKIIFTWSDLYPILEILCQL